MNKSVKALYENAAFPAATVDANGYITWVNKKAKDAYPVLFARNGLRSLARFSEDREMISRLVEDGVGGSLVLRGQDLTLTFSPLPETGKELLLTAAKTNGNTAPDTLASPAVPAIRDILSRLNENAGIIAEAKRLPPKIEDGVDGLFSCCTELQNTVDHMALYAALTNGMQPAFGVCNTSAFFSELLSAVCRLLKENAPETEVRGHGWIVTDYTLASRLVLLLLANALEHGDGDIRVHVVSDRELAVTVTNRVRPENVPTGADELKRPFVSLVGENANDRLGIGLTLADRMASLLGGSLEISVADGVFTASVLLPSAGTEDPPTVQLKRETEYLADRYDPVHTELGRFKPKNGKGTARQ